MSGGSWDYVYGRFNDVAERLKRERNIKRKALGVLVEKIGIAMHDIEWVDSGDCSPGDEIKAIDDVLNFNASEVYKAAILEEIENLRKQVLELK